MHEFISKFLRICPRSGKLKGIRRLEGGMKFLIPFAGFLALLWVVFRVATKPSRIEYPCVRAAMPLASGFIGELIILAASGIAFIRSRKVISGSRTVLIGMFFAAGIGGSLWVNDVTRPEKTAVFHNIYLEPNKPVGTPRGIFPGRVVWVHDSNAVNQNCSPATFGHAWFLAENNNQPMVDTMVSTAIRLLTGTSTDAGAWDSIFVFFNRNHGRGNIGYQTGEIVFIKTNATSSWGGNFSTTDLSDVRNYSYGISETSPAMVLAVLRQLVNKAGVPESDIYVGDPMKHIYKHCYDQWHPEFPNVHYLDHDGYMNLGREKALVSPTSKIYYSDNDSVLLVNGTPVHSDFVYKIFDDATYVIDLPMMKGHLRAGTTMFAKNNFGSHTRPGADHLHAGLVDPGAVGVASRPGYGRYRVLVDLMGSKAVSGKHLFYLMDALWSTDKELGFPKKWRTPPFNNTFSASVFASFDPVAIECVGYDFLRSEFTYERNQADGCETCVQMSGVDDYLLQAADTSAWPAGIRYDPDSSGIHPASLGVYEHWNDSLHREYTRNLGTGNGIELVKVETLTGMRGADLPVPEEFVLYPNFPNPFNPSTEIRYQLSAFSHVTLKVYDVVGREIKTLVDEGQKAGSYSVRFDARGLSSGMYLVRMEAGRLVRTQKIVFLK